MNFENLADFLTMRGFARFVWPAYAVALGVLLFNALSARRALTQAKNEARRRLAMQSTP